ncbi:hypothetical protein LU276_05615 [Moraxella haemolytica]|uniref:hypothetical protein n=1 Tax=Moraxella haemolytica TaxID=2904119 RepID=UPI0025439529|nr:hypothetical protein [Moraxella sp. ZY171148]WII94515.1 hypothetical protein LU276_05615 [Moraxella sp. ZY171148]
MSISVSFFKNLDNLLKDVENNNIVDEWYLYDFIDTNIKRLNAQQSFDILKLYVPYMINMYSFDYEILNILFALKDRANTNEKFYTEDQKNIILSIYHQDVEVDRIKDIFY